MHYADEGLLVNVISLRGRREARHPPELDVTSQQARRPARPALRVGLVVARRVGAPRISGRERLARVLDDLGAGG